jgi:hypothetical protein
MNWSKNKVVDAHRGRGADAASATIAQDLLTVPREPVTSETADALAQGGFSSELVALAQELADSDTTDEPEA